MLMASLGRVVTILLCGMLLDVGRLSAAPLAGGAGYEYATGPDGLATRSIYGLVGADVGSSSLALSMAHFDDHQLGGGESLTAASRWAIVPAVGIRLSGSGYRTYGQSQGWRLATGPEFSLARMSVGLLYARSHTNDPASSNAETAELGVPLGLGLTSHVSASVIEQSGYRNATAGAVGLTWAPRHFLELSSSVGFASRSTVTTVTQPSTHHLLPLLGGGDTGGTPESRTSSTAGMSLRVGARLTAP